MAKRISMVSPSMTEAAPVTEAAYRGAVALLERLDTEDAGRQGGVNCPRGPCWEPAQATLR